MFMYNILAVVMASGTPLAIVGIIMMSAVNQNVKQQTTGFENQIVNRSVNGWLSNNKEHQLDEIESGVPIADYASSPTSKVRRLAQANGQGSTKETMDNFSLISEPNCQFNIQTLFRPIKNKVYTV